MERKVLVVIFSRRNKFPFKFYFFDCSRKLRKCVKIRSLLTTIWRKEFSLCLARTFYLISCVFEENERNGIYVVIRFHRYTNILVSASIRISKGSRRLEKNRCGRKRSTLLLCTATGHATRRHAFVSPLESRSLFAPTRAEIPIRAKFSG